MTSNSIFDNPMPRRPGETTTSDTLSKGAVRGLGLLGGFVGVLLFAGLVAFDGWATATLWRWFVSDTFGITEIGVAQAVGLGIVVAIITGPKVYGDNDGGRIVRAMVISPPALLAFGWIILQFV